MDLQAIVDEADVLVPNSYGDSDKVIWLNEVNHDFFEKVKIPLIATFTTTAGTAAYSLNANVRAKNIDYCKVGTAYFRNLLYEDVPPGTNNHIFDEDTEEITLDPAPSRAGQKGIVRYFRIASTSFSTTDMDEQEPDAPKEYHWVYTLGLCERIAKAMDDAVKANNYAGSYAAAILTAQQNYGQQGEGQ